MGEGQGAAEEGGLAYPGSIQAVKIALEDALPLLSEYAEERTPVLTVFGTPRCRLPK
jgi:hypothetical protein